MQETNGLPFQIAPEGAGEWAGRTWTTRDLGDIASEVDRVAKGQQVLSASQLGPAWMSQLIEFGLTAPEGGPAPAPGRHVAPMTLPLALPGQGIDCPTSLIEPWWRIVKLPEVPSAPVASAPLAEIRAKDTRLVPSTKLAGNYRGHPIVSGGEPVGAQLDVTDRWIALWAHRRFTERTVRGPGFFGSFVPVYSHGRAIASMASESHEDVLYGCRIPFEFIDSVRLDQWFWIDDGGPLAGPRHKRLLQERGYARPSEFRIRFRVYDGWSWHHLDLIGDGPHVDHEERLPEFMAWLVQWVAHHRSHHSDLGDADRVHLGRIASGESGLELGEQRLADRHCVSRMLVMPGARPISAELTS